MRKEKLKVKIFTQWRSTSSWGWLPEVDLYVSFGTRTEHTNHRLTSGAGFDKESAAVAEAIEKSKILTSLLKTRYSQAQGAPRGLYRWGSTPGIEKGIGMQEIDRILQWLGLKKVKEEKEKWYHEYIYEGEITVV